VCAFAAGGFLVYGGRLFAMLRRFPVESRGRQKKLREVGAVTAVCATCFTIRAGMVCASAFAETKDGLDVMNHPVRNAIYYADVRDRTVGAGAFHPSQAPREEHARG
jgi:hypothetical protein